MLGPEEKVRDNNSAKSAPADSDSTVPHYWGHRKRLRERFLRSGLEGFADYEVVELLLTLAIPRSDVKHPAKKLIARFRNIRGILDAPLEELQKIDGIGSVTPVALRVIREAANLYLQQSAEHNESLIEHEALAKFWRAKIGALPNEVFQVGYLDSGYRLLREGIDTLEEGTIDRATVYPRRLDPVDLCLARRLSCDDAQPLWCSLMEVTMKYMLLIYFQEKAGLSEQERQECYDASVKLAEELRSNRQFVAASPLHPTAMATSVRVRDGGKRLVTDGPFAETREQLGGYFLIEAKSLDDAIAVAAQIPMARHGTVEVRPVIEF